jgi:hypothetical protein
LWGESSFYFECGGFCSLWKLKKLYWSSIITIDKSNFCFRNFILMHPGGSSRLKDQGQKRTPQIQQAILWWPLVSLRTWA